MSRRVHDSQPHIKMQAYGIKLDLSHYIGNTVQFNVSISLEMPVPSQGHYGFHSFRLLTDFVCLYTYEF